MASAKLSRRGFLQGSLLAAAAPALLVRGLGAAPRPGDIRREVFLRPPRPGTAVIASTCYTRRQGLDVISVHEIFSRSDTTDVAYLRYSKDNGRTWTPGEEIPTLENRPQGKLRRAMRGCILDPFTGRFLHFRNEGVLPNDDPLEGMRQWAAFYRVSEDGGLTWYLDEAVIQKGKEFDPAIAESWWGTSLPARSSSPTARCSCR